MVFSPSINGWLRVPPWLWKPTISFNTWLNPHLGITRSLPKNSGFRRLDRFSSWLYFGRITWEISISGDVLGRFLGWLSFPNMVKSLFFFNVFFDHSPSEKMLRHWREKIDSSHHLDTFVFSILSRWSHCKKSLDECWWFSSVPFQCLVSSLRKVQFPLACIGHTVTLSTQKSKCLREWPEIEEF